MHRSKRIAQLGSVLFAILLHATSLAAGNHNSTSTSDRDGGGGVHQTSSQGEATGNVSWPTEYALVRPDGSGDFPTIQEAIDAVDEGGIVELTDGVFGGLWNRNLDFGGKAITLRSQSGDASSCIIDCADSLRYDHRAIHFHSGESAETVVEDVTLANGWKASGGAILCEPSPTSEPSNPTIRRCVFDGNRANDGAGMYVIESAPTITDCIFRNGTCVNSGGGIRLEDATGTIMSGCVFENNDITNAGGGVMVIRSDLTVSDCGFRGNSAFVGAGLYTVLSTITVDACTFVGNEASFWGGGFFSTDDDLVVTGCTFTDNDADDGGGIYADFGIPTIENCLVAFNAGGGGISSESVPIMTCCDLYGNVGGDYVGNLSGLYGVSGNISEDPLFCDAPGGDYTLDCDSPCAAENNPECGQIGVHGIGCGIIGIGDGPLVATDPLSIRPNPSTGVTRIAFDAPLDAELEVIIVNASGQLVEVYHPTSSRGTITWDGMTGAGHRAAPGVYFVCLRTGAATTTQRLLLIR